MIALGLARALGLRGTVILACLLVLVVTAYGVAQDLGLVEPPAQAARRPSRPAGCRPKPTRAATADIPRSYLRLYCKAGARYRIPWSVLAAVGKVESDHGRVRLPGVRSGSNWAGACGPMQIGCVPGSKAGNSWARYGRGRPHDPAERRSRPRPGIWSTTAPAATSTGRSTPTTTPGPTWPRSSSSPAATPEAVGAGDRGRAGPRRPPPGSEVAGRAPPGPGRLRAAVAAGRLPAHRPAPPGGPGPDQPAAARRQARDPGRGRPLPCAQCRPSPPGGSGPGRGGVAGLDRRPTLDPAGPGRLGVPAVLPRPHHRRPPAPRGQRLSGVSTPATTGAGPTTSSAASASTATPAGVGPVGWSRSPSRPG